MPRRAERSRADPAVWTEAPEGTKETKLAAEIANGRLAMMAIIGMFFQNGLTGMDQFGGMVEVVAWVSC